MKRKFITFEGPEGSGKTSVLKAVEARLKRRGVDVLSTREPGGSDIAEQIRQIILDIENRKMEPRTEAMLYAAARRQHISEVIWPALEDEKVVLCDRFVDSSLAYQGYGRQLGYEAVYDLNLFAINGCLPDLTIFIDVPPTIGLDRVFDNSRDVNRLDLESLTFHERVYRGYQLLIDKEPGRIKVVDGNRPVEDVVPDVMALIGMLEDT